MYKMRWISSDFIYFCKFMCFFQYNILNPIILSKKTKQMNLELCVDLDICLGIKLRVKI